MARVDQAAAAGGYLLGWRLLASPASVLKRSEVAFIGLNPGGNADVPEHGRLCPLVGSAYVTESWNGRGAGLSPLQVQVRRLFASLDVAPETVLAGNLVPFRSPSWETLPARDRALDFGTALWREILSASRPKLVIAMSGLVFDRLSKMLGVHKVNKIPAGWGDVSLRVGRSSSHHLVGLPHLSRFALLGRPASVESLSQAFAPHWKGLRQVEEGLKGYR